jgi:hypothetical protein
MNRMESRAVFAGLLLKQVRDERFPSATHMDMIEQTIPPQLLDRYVEVLLEKVAHDDHPSIPMLQRLRRVILSMPS